MNGAARDACGHPSRQPAAPGASRAQARGFSYVEVLVATGLMMVSLAPALDALSTGVNVGRVQSGRTQLSYALRSRLEDVLAQPFSALEAAAAAAGAATTATSYSDPGGTAQRLLVYLAHYDSDNADGDADPLTGGEPDLLWIRVARENSIDDLQTLVSR